MAITATLFLLDWDVQKYLGQQIVFLWILWTFSCVIFGFFEGLSGWHIIKLFSNWTAYLVFGGKKLLNLWRWVLVIQSKFNQTAVKIQSKSSQNPVKIQSKSSQNPVKIQSKFSQNPVKIQSKFSQNSVKIQSKFRQNSVKCSQNAVKIKF